MFQMSSALCVCGRRLGARPPGVLIACLASHFAGVLGLGPVGVLVLTRAVLVGLLRHPLAVLARLALVGLIETGEGLMIRCNDEARVMKTGGGGGGWGRAEQVPRSLTQTSESWQPQLPQVIGQASPAVVPSSSSESQYLLGFLAT